MYFFLSLTLSFSFPPLFLSFFCLSLSLFVSLPVSYLSLSIFFCSHHSAKHLPTFFFLSLFLTQFFSLSLSLPFFSYYFSLSIYIYVLLTLNITCASVLYKSCQLGCTDGKRKKGFCHNISYCIRHCKRGVNLMSFSLND